MLDLDYLPDKQIPRYIYFKHIKLNDQIQDLDWVVFIPIQFPLITASD